MFPPWYFQNSIHLGFLILPYVFQKRLFKTYVSYEVKEWKYLSTEARNSSSYQQFRKSFLSLIKST